MSFATGNSEVEGQGLLTKPLLGEFFQTDLLDWQMSPSEQVMIMYLIEHLRPRAAIEIGTRFGGSLQVLARHCGRVYSLDIDPEVKERLKGRFENVEYLIGRSDETLPPLIDRLQREKTEVGFALIDGDHSTDGVRRDIDNILRYKPSTTLYIIMHDSFNPVVRGGLTARKLVRMPLCSAGRTGPRRWQRQHVPEFPRSVVGRSGDRDSHAGTPKWRPGDHRRIAIDIPRGPPGFPTGPAS